MYVGWSVKKKWESFQQRKHMDEGPQMEKTMKYYRKRNQSRMTGALRVRESISAICLSTLYLNASSD